MFFCLVLRSSGRDNPPPSVWRVEVRSCVLSWGRLAKYYRSRHFLSEELVPRRVSPRGK